MRMNLFYRQIKKNIPLINLIISSTGLFLQCRTMIKNKNNKPN